MNTKIALTDTETENDSLNIGRYVQGCADFILNCETPMSIAVQGDWGTGKSSFMRMVENKIKVDGITVIRFNTWQYSRVNDDRLFLPMLTVLTEQIDKAWRANHPNDKEYEEYFNGEGKGVIRIPPVFGKLSSAIGAFFGSGWAAAGAEIVKFLSEGGVKQEEDYYKTVVSIREKLQERIDVLTGAATISEKKEIPQTGTATIFEQLEVQQIGATKNSEKEIHKTGKRTGRVVIFIDDLDRLRPSCAVGLLEDMKNFMDCEGCVFVLALDHKLVQNGVRAKYGDMIDDTYARKFFEKIVQIPFYLPVKSYDTRKYIEELLHGGHLEELLDADKCTETVNMFTDGNPRVIKRAFNAFRMNRMMDPQGEKEDQKKIFALLLLQSVNEDLYNEMVRVLAEAKTRIYFENSEIDIHPSPEWERKNPGEWQKVEYLRGLYNRDDYRLREDIFRSTMLESSHFSTSGDERDKVFELICDYLEDKGLEKKYTAGSRSSCVFTGKNTEIEVVKFENAGHANVNFKSLTGEKEEELFARLEKSGNYYRKEESEIHLLFDEGNEESYIGKGGCVYIRKATYDRRVFLAIGDIVDTALKED